MKLVAVLLQVFGAALAVAALALLFGAAAGVLAGGLFLFAAGLAFERGW